MTANINTKLLNTYLSKYILGKNVVINTYIYNLINYEREVLNNIKNKDKYDVIYKLKLLHLLTKLFYVIYVYIIF